jgi:hypothetical protein
LALVDRRVVGEAGGRLLACHYWRSMSEVHLMFRVETLPRRVDDVLAVRCASVGSGCEGIPRRTPFVRTTFQDMAPAMPTSRPGPSQINADLQDLAHQVHQEFDDRLDPGTIDENLTKVAARFADARVRSFVPPAGAALRLRRTADAPLMGLLEFHEAMPALRAGIDRACRVLR